MDNESTADTPLPIEQTSNKKRSIFYGLKVSIIFSVIILLLYALLRGPVYTNSGGLADFGEIFILYVFLIVIVICSFLGSIFIFVRSGKDNTDKIISIQSFILTLWSFTIMGAVVIYIVMPRVDFGEASKKQSDELTEKEMREAGLYDYQKQLFTNCKEERFLSGKNPLQLRADGTNPGWNEMMMSTKTFGFECDGFFPTDSEFYDLEYQVTAHNKDGSVVADETAILIDDQYSGFVRKKINKGSHRIGIYFFPDSPNTYTSEFDGYFSLDKLIVTYHPSYKSSDPRYDRVVLELKEPINGARYQYIKPADFTWSIR